MEAFVELQTNLYLMTVQLDFLLKSSGSKLKHFLSSRYIVSNLYIVVSDSLQIMNVY